MNDTSDISSARVPTLSYRSEPFIEDHARRCVDLPREHRAAIALRDLQPCFAGIQQDAGTASPAGPHIVLHSLVDCSLQGKCYRPAMTSGDGGEVVSDGSAWAFDRSRFADGAASAAMTALESAHVGVVVIDADLRFAFANEVAANINGRSAADHIGASLFEILSGTGDEMVAQMVREVMRSGEALLGQEIVSDTQARPGEIRVWMGDYHPWHLPGEETSGAANAVLVVFSEITETRRAERRLRQVIDGLFTFVGLCDVDGTLLEANEFALRAAGLEAADVIGRPFWDCSWWSHDTEVQQLVRQAVADAAIGQRCRFDTSWLVNGSRIIPIEFQLVPVIENGRVISLVPSGLDIEARAIQVRNLAELSALAAELHDALGMHELVNLIVGRASGLFGTSLVSFAVIDAHDNSMRVTIPAELEHDIAVRWSTLTADGPRTPFHDVAASGRAVWVYDRAVRRSRYPDMADDSDRAGLMATAALPLTDANGVIGVLGLGWPTDIEDDAALQLQCALLANICAQALHRVIRTRSTMELVNSLSAELMARRDHTDHLDVAVGYVPAESEIGFGGDWYDVVSVSSTITALIVGDVVGHNVEAAAQMAIARGALRTAVLALPDLVGVGALVTRSLGLVEREFFATAVVVMVDTERAELRWKSFGHVPALVLAPDGSVTRLVATGPPIGLLVDSTSIGTVRYEPGSMIVLYTDGLIETRADPIDERIDELAIALAAISAGTSPSEVARVLLESVAPDDPGDDIAIVVAALPGN